MYEVDSFRPDGIKASRNGCGYGYRYTLRTSCEDEENYGKRYFLYLEQYGIRGRWRCEETEITMVRVMWDQYGGIEPLYITLEDGSVYKVKTQKQYPMSTRKSDGAGMRHIVTGSCPDLDDIRTFTLMLENGGEFLGSWFLEDYCETDDWNENLYANATSYK